MRFDYYSRHGCALFPIPAGSKAPTGIVESFARDCSADPQQWERWRADHPNCNFGIVAGASRLIIVDIDVNAIGRDAAWAAWCELCATWGIAVVSPHVQSARGGWHVLFQCDAPDLRQPDAIKKIINIRAGNGYVVAAGSYYDGTAKGEQSGWYSIISDAPPHPAPAALIEHCTRAIRDKATATGGDYDAADVGALVQWLAERDQFDSYEDWFQCGMALRLALGDAGLQVWRLATWAKIDDATLAAKWASFAVEPGERSVTLHTFLSRAHKLGWKGQVRRAAGAMFGDAASLPAGAIPMTGNERALVEIAAPILAAVPRVERMAGCLALPATLARHALFDAINTALPGIVATPESTDAAAIVALIDRGTFDALAQCAPALDTAAALHRATGIEATIKRRANPPTDYSRDVRGSIEGNNLDNVAVFLGALRCEVRFNAWMERNELRGAPGVLDLHDWTPVTDDHAAALRMHGSATGIRFTPAKDFFWDALTTLARRSVVDPVLNQIDALETAWDGTPRLAIWLVLACGTRADAYHQAVGKLIIGNMVRRIREPGCKADEVALFHGSQGTGKSTLARLLAPTPESFTDEILLGDASKELVLSLAGKSVIEIGEMGSRSVASVDHIKAMISRQTDRGRTAYARTVTERPRRNIFIATSNDDEPLTDRTGNRRFLPIKIEREINLEWMRANVGQLIGEAAALHSQGVSFALPREVWGIAAEHQDSVRERPAFETSLREWLAPTPFTANAYVTAADLVEFVRGAAGHAVPPRRYASTMRALGFSNVSQRVNGKVIQVWRRGEPGAAVRIEPQSDRGRTLPRVSMEVPTVPLRVA